MATVGDHDVVKKTKKTKTLVSHCHTRVRACTFVIRTNTVDMHMLFNKNPIPTGVEIVWDNHE